MPSFALIVAPPVLVASKSVLASFFSPSLPATLNLTLLPVGALSTFAVTLTVTSLSPPVVTLGVSVAVSEPTVPVSPFVSANAGFAASAVASKVNLYVPSCCMPKGAVSVIVAPAAAPFTVTFFPARLKFSAKVFVPPIGANVTVAV